MHAARPQPPPRAGGGASSPPCRGLGGEGGGGRVGGGREGRGRTALDYVCCATLHCAAHCTTLRVLCRAARCALHCTVLCCAVHCALRAVLHCSVRRTALLCAQHAVLHRVCCAAPFRVRRAALHMCDVPLCTACAGLCHCTLCVPCRTALRVRRCSAPVAAGSRKPGREGDT